MQNHFRLRASIWAVLFLLVTPLGAHGSDLPTGAAHEAGSAALSGAPFEREKFVSMKIPIDSPYFAETPVALVNEEPITLGELVGAIGPPSESETKPGGEDADYHNVLQRMINLRLIIQEARNIGLDESSAIQTELENFKQKTLLQELIRQHLEGLQPDPADVQEVYQQISREVLLDTLTFDSGAEAQRFLDELKDGDFEQLAKRYIEEGKAREERAEQYVRLKDLLPQVGQQAYSMEKGGVSKIFRTEQGFLFFRLADSRFVEDEAVEKEAVKIVSDTFRKQKAMEYSNNLTEKYAIIDEALYEQLDFDEDFEVLKKDTRVLATIKGEEPVTITIAGLADQMDISLFHGTDKAQQSKLLNSRKESTFANMLFKITGELEAQRLGLDKSDEFVKKMEDFERSLLFKAFMDKVVRPDVKLTAEEIRTYYDEHIDEYSSPAMLRMNSLVFDNRQDAESALDKLHKGADFKWVSANATGFVPPDTEGLLPFDEKLLSLTSLPDGLRETASGAKKGDSLLYAEPEGDYYYVLLIEQIYSPEPQPYDQAKDEVAKTVFDMKFKQLLDEWTAKLKAFYPTQIFLTDLGQ